MNPRPGLQNRRIRRRRILASAIVLVVVSVPFVTRWLWPVVAPRPPVSGPAIAATESLSPFQRAVLADLDRQIHANIAYDASYYVGGVPPPGIGVCTDVVLQSYKAAGVNLQKEVTRDVAANRDAYHIARPDPNIDHRRCRVLAVFFKRHAISLPTNGPHADWQPADIVIFDWEGNGEPTHIAVVSNAQGLDGAPLMVHHLPGAGVTMTDGLTQVPILYHFRWKTALRHSPSHVA